MAVVLPLDTMAAIEPAPIWALRRISLCNLEAKARIADFQRRVRRRLDNPSRLNKH